MDIYVQIKNKKGEVLKVVNIGREEYLSLFKEHLKKMNLAEDDAPVVFFNEFKQGNYLDVKKVKKLKEEIKAIAGIIGKDLDYYKEFIQKRTQLENEIFNRSSLKNLMIIGMRRLEEVSADEIPDVEAELDSIRKEIDRLSKSEHLLEEEREKFQAVFDIELLFDILSESVKSSSGIYIKN
ncbi:MAG: hypothetical protein ACYCSB_03535 [bacterium]|jgi:hypothetical protein